VVRARVVTSAEPGVECRTKAWIGVIDEAMAGAIGWSKD
jgi:hypothetical protein